MCTVYLPCSHWDLALWSNLVSDSRYVCVPCIYPAVTGTWPYGPIWRQIAGMYVYHVSTLPSQGPGRMVPSVSDSRYVCVRCIYPAVNGTWPYGPIWRQIAGMYVYHVSILPSPEPGRMVPSGVR